MGVLVITCSQTGTKFSTDIQIERRDSKLIDVETVATSLCPHCREVHEWRYRDAEYVEDWIENK
jgi:GTP cyclohydrolase FolE2